MEPNEKSETYSILSLEVSQEQKDAIYHFFAHNDWEFKEVQILPIMIKAGMIQVMEIILLSRMTIFMNIYCFCRPCITNERNRQLWWETDNQIEHERNSQLKPGIHDASFASKSPFKFFDRVYHTRNLNQKT